MVKYFESPLFTSNSEEWSTPQDLFDQLDKHFNFDLDAAASDKNHKCKKYFTKEQDSLKQDWTKFRSIYLNPPYGRQIGQWIEQSYITVYSLLNEKTKCESVVLLLPSRTDTRWFHKFCTKGLIVFLPGRLKFGDSKNSAPFPSMIVVFNRKYKPKTFFSLDELFKYTKCNWH